MDTLNQALARAGLLTQGGIILVLGFPADTNADQQSAMDPDVQEFQNWLYRRGGYAGRMPARLSRMDSHDQARARLTIAFETNALHEPDSPFLTHQVRTDLFEVWPGLQAELGSCCVLGHSLELMLADAVIFGASLLSASNQDFGATPRELRELMFEVMAMMIEQSSVDRATFANSTALSDLLRQLPMIGHDEEATRLEQLIAWHAEIRG